MLELKTSIFACMHEQYEKEQCEEEQYEENGAGSRGPSGLPGYVTIGCTRTSQYALQHNVEDREGVGLRVHGNPKEHHETSGDSHHFRMETSVWRSVQFQSTGSLSVLARPSMGNASRCDSSIGAFYLQPPSLDVIKVG